MGWVWLPMRGLTASVASEYKSARPAATSAEVGGFVRNRCPASIGTRWAESTGLSGRLRRNTQGRRAAEAQHASEPPGRGLEASGGEEADGPGAAPQEASGGFGLDRHKSA